MQMRERMFSRRSTLVLLAGLIVSSASLAAQSDALAMLRGLTKGEWTIKYRDGSPDTKLCLRTGQEVIQIRHAQTDCSRFVIEDGPAEVAVQYTCPGDGYGRTDIRKENASLIQIQSQGIASGVPFQFTAEGRLTGSC